MALSGKGAALLADLHPQMAESRTIQAVVDVVARELQRVENAGAGVRDRSFPLSADDTYNTLAILELMLGLPVKPSGTTLAQRQALVGAGFHKRRAASGADWTDLVSQALGSNAWTQQEGPGSYQITIRIPYQAGGFVPGQITNLVRRITPAHLTIATGFTGGFLVGASAVGDVI